MMGANIKDIDPLITLESNEIQINQGVKILALPSQRVYRLNK